MDQAATFDDEEVSSPFHSSEDSVVKLIGILVYDGFSLLGAATLAEALRFANELQSRGTGKTVTYSVRLVSARGGAIACSSSSVCAWTERLGGNRFLGFDALYVAGGSGVTRAAADEGLTALVRIACSQSAVVSALGSGDVLLAGAGVARRDLASVGRGAWNAGTSKVSPLSEGGEAMIHSLALIKRDLGYDMATAVANRLTSSNDQHLPIMLSTIGTGTRAEKAQESARWLERNCGRQISVGDAARTIAMSERNFLRLFKREMGTTPSQYLLQARLNLGCELLARSDLPIDKIARRTGLTNGERFSKVFKKQFAMSPTEYRNRRKNGDTVQAATS
ncbi:transcriptional regulator, AraC family [Burkholderia sp. H160]|nr:transcriptional regulator, AraC family [Burkholderia sp. H160]